MPSGDHVYRIKITLLDVKPPIWRRIELLDDASFWDLHVAIQDAMGWLDCHLHEFSQFGRVHPDEAIRIGLPFDDMDDFGGPETAPSWLMPMSAVLTLYERRLRYLYDFGDGWEHEIRLERIQPLARSDAREAFPRCVGGRRACPPEDVGGVGMYEELVRQLAAAKGAEKSAPTNSVDPADDEDEDDDIAEHYPGYDPEVFDPAAVTFDDAGTRLAALMRSM